MRRLSLADLKRPRYIYFVQIDAEAIHLYARTLLYTLHDPSDAHNVRSRFVK